MSNQPSGVDPMEELERGLSAIPIDGEPLGDSATNAEGLGSSNFILESGKCMSIRIAGGI